VGWGLKARRDEERRAESENPHPFVNTIL